MLEWGPLLVNLFAAIGVALSVLFAYVWISDKQDVKNKPIIEPKHHLDYEEDWNVQTLIYVANKAARRVTEHNEWDRAYGPPYYYENKEAEFLQLEDDKAPWLTDVQIRQIKRHPNG